MDERRNDLCCYRLKKAQKCLASEKILVQSGDYCSAAKWSEESGKEDSEGPAF